MDALVLDAEGSIFDAEAEEESELKVELDWERLRWRV